MSKTVISITPISLERDSRALKIAHSFYLEGYRSIVLEGEKSKNDYSSLGVELHQIYNSTPADTTITTEESNPKYFLSFLWSLLKRINIKFLINYLAFLNHKRAYYTKYKKSLLNNLPEANFYYLHSYEYFLSLKDKIDYKKLIYDAHDFYPHINPKQKILGDKLIQDFQERIEKQVIEKANVFLTVSNGLKMLYEKYSGKSPDVLLNSHERKIDEVPMQSLRENLAIKKTSKVLLIVGNYKLGQALKEIVRAFLSLAYETDLVFIGEGYEHIKNNLDENSLKKIHFLGRVNPKVIVPLAKEADLGILPYFDFTNNYKYALPNGFFQMIAAGLPILFSKKLVEVFRLNELYGFGIATSFNNLTLLEEDLNIALNKDLTKGVEKSQASFIWENEWNNLKKRLNII